MNGLLLICFHAYYFLNLVPGVSAVSSGASSALAAEGLSAFHNPAATDDFMVNFTVSRWLYTTNQVVAGFEYKHNCVGILYNDYGSIQGYDRFGNETTVFRPGDFVLAIGRDLGPCGISVKAFQEVIGDFKLYGFALGCGAYKRIGRLALGIKFDNIGRDLANGRSLQFISSAGVKYGIIKDILDVNISGTIPDYMMMIGFSYNHTIVTVNCGIRSYFPEDRLSSGQDAWKDEDLDLTAGLIVNVENYRIGYSLLVDQYSSAHQFSIVIDLLETKN